MVAETHDAGAVVLPVAALPEALTPFRTLASPIVTLRPFGPLLPLRPLRAFRPLGLAARSGARPVPARSVRTRSGRSSSSRALCPISVLGALAARRAFGTVLPTAGRIICRIRRDLNGLVALDGLDPTVLALFAGRPFPVPTPACALASTLDPGASSLSSGGGRTLGQRRTVPDDVLPDQFLRPPRGTSRRRARPA